MTNREPRPRSKAERLWWRRYVHRTGYVTERLLRLLDERRRMLLRAAMARNRFVASYFSDTWIGKRVGRALDRGLSWHEATGGVKEFI